MPAEAILSKFRRAVRNETGVTFTCVQVCELIDLGVLDILATSINDAIKAEARSRLSESKRAQETAGYKPSGLTRESIAELTRSA